MCGIAGISLPLSAESPAYEAALGRMAAALGHRGPDDRGLQLLRDGDGRPGVLLANTRLAILDLSEAGHQPMYDPATGNWIVFNGEIYNHHEVRAALEKRAEPWRSSSDTETVLRAYALWGPACLSRLRGMFAFAIWDRAQGTLWCVRDRLGIKPFYYYRTAEGAFLLASEVRALLASGLVPRRLDPRGLAGYVRFGSIPDALTLVEGVASLPAGHWIRVRAGSVEDVRAYWRSEPQAIHATSAEAAREVRAHLERAVHEHLLSDVPVASFLSGGMDSSIVTALAARHSQRPLETFTFGFRERKLDESRYAQEVAERNGTLHHRVLLSEADVSALVPRAVAAMDLPSADGVNTYVIAGAAATRGIKVALSGLGGDELFGGYPSFRLLPRAQRWAPWLGRFTRVVPRLAAGRRGTAQRIAEITAAAIPLRHRYEAFRSFWSMGELRSMGLTPRVVYRADDPGPGFPLPTRVSCLELSGYMRSTLLRDADAMSMAHSLEMRVPFLDHELVEHCLRVGAAGFHAGSRPKALLRQAVGDLLPTTVAKRAKQGFVLPLDGWMRRSLRGFVTEGLRQVAGVGALPVRHVMDAEARFAEGRLPWTCLWEFVVLGHWLAAHGSWDQAPTHSPGEGGPYGRSQPEEPVGVGGRRITDALRAA